MLGDAPVGIDEDKVIAEVGDEIPVQSFSSCSRREISEMRCGGNAGGREDSLQILGEAREGKSLRRMQR